MYRFIADTGGAFVQPALYEAFGLTVIEVSAQHPLLSKPLSHHLSQQVYEPSCDYPRNMHD